MLLDHSNYMAWKSYMQKRLEDEGLWGITTGTEIMIEEQNQVKVNNKTLLEEFKKKSRLAFYLLIKSIDDSVIFSVSALDFENNPSELWKVLQSKYQPNDLLLKLEAFNKLRSLTFNKKDPHQFIDSIRDCFAELDQVGFTFDESTWMVLFLSQLPHQVADMILDSPRPEDVSTDSIRVSAPITSCEYLFEKLRTLPLQHTNSTASTDANHQSHQKQRDSISISAETNHSVSNTRIVLSCSKCNRKGHDIQHCWIANPHLNPYNQNKNFGSYQKNYASATPNGHTLDNNNNDKKLKNGKTGWAPHQKDQNNPDQWNHQTNNIEKNNPSSQNHKYHNQNESNGYQKKYDQNKDFFKKSNKKTFQEGQIDSTSQSSKWSKNEKNHHQVGEKAGGWGKNNNNNNKQPKDVKENQPMVERTGGWRNTNTNNHQEQLVGWGNNNDNLNEQIETEWTITKQDNSTDRKKITSTSGWTENGTDFEVSDTPPNQWTV